MQRKTLMKCQQGYNKKKQSNASRHLEDGRKIEACWEDGYVGLLLLQDGKMSS